MSRTSAPAPPPELTGYRFIKNIGAGGNAQVYLYEQHLPRRKVAVKVLNESALSEAARRRFTAEANVTAGLVHRHIVQIFEANVTSDGRPYLVMPYYPQPNLAIRARRAHFSVAEVLSIGVRIGSAVETSHRRGVLHHDIKPQNILTDSAYDEPVLTDFGIATTKGGDGPEGLSVPWSPPEILFGTGPADERADVYSLGATLWHLLVGRSPYESPGDNGTTALMARIQSSPPPPTQRGDVPDSLERLLRQAMAKDPAARPQSAMELISGLQAIERELGLPVTRTVLPADEPAGDTQGTDTIPRLGPVQPSAPAPAAWGDTGQTAWGTPPRAETVIRNGTVAQWAPPAAARPADNMDNVTLTRGPMRIDPRGAGPAPAAPPRERQFPRQAPESATVARPLTAAPGGMDSPGPAGQGRRAGGRGRVLALVGGGVALAVVAGVAVVALSHGGGQPNDTPAGAPATQSGGADNAIAPAGPTQPELKVVALSATEARFTWTYQNAATGDTFTWLRSGTAGKATGQVTQPELVVAVPAGKIACLEVRVTSAVGTATAYSDPLCWPQ